MIDNSTGETTKSQTATDETRAGEAATGETTVRLLLSTAPATEAADLARRLVEERLAACVNLLPRARSIYRWEGAICSDDETLMILKTVQSSVQALQERLVELHSYDVPEVLVLPVESGNPQYLEWVMASVSRASGD